MGMSFNQQLFNSKLPESWGYSSHGHGGGGGSYGEGGDAGCYGVAGSAGGGGGSGACEITVTSTQGSHVHTIGEVGAVSGTLCFGEDESTVSGVVEVNTSDENYVGFAWASQPGHISNVRISKGAARWGEFSGWYKKKQKNTWTKVREWCLDWFYEMFGEEENDG